MSEYKKEAPENQSYGVTHSGGSNTIPDIECHLAEILNLIRQIREDSLLNIDYHCDYKEEFEEIIQRVRQTWDLVPDDKGWKDGNRCPCSKDTYHCDCSPICCYCSKDKNENP